MAEEKTEEEKERLTVELRRELKKHYPSYGTERWEKLDENTKRQLIARVKEEVDLRAWAKTIGTIIYEPETDAQRDFIKAHPGAEYLSEAALKLTMTLAGMATDDRIAITTPMGYHTLPITDFIKYFNTREGQQWIERGLDREWIERHIGYYKETIGEDGLPTTEWVSRLVPVTQGTYDPVTGKMIGPPLMGFPMTWDPEGYALGWLGYNINRYKVDLRYPERLRQGETVQAWQARVGGFSQGRLREIESQTLKARGLFPDLTAQYKASRPQPRLSPWGTSENWAEYLRQAGRYQPTIKTVGY